MTAEWTAKKLNEFSATECHHDLYHESEFVISCPISNSVSENFIQGHGACVKQVSLSSKGGAWASASVIIEHHISYCSLW